MFKRQIVVRIQMIFFGMLWFDILFLALAPRIKRLQRINLTVPTTNNLPSPSLDEFPAPWLRHVQANKTNIFGLPPTWQ